MDGMRGGGGGRGGEEREPTLIRAGAGAKPNCLWERRRTYARGSVCAEEPASRPRRAGRGWLRERACVGQPGPTEIAAGRAWKPGAEAPGAPARCSVRSCPAVRGIVCLLRRLPGEARAALRVPRRGRCSRDSRFVTGTWAATVCLRTPAGRRPRQDAAAKCRSRWSSHEGAGRGRCARCGMRAVCVRRSHAGLVYSQRTRRARGHGACLCARHARPTRDVTRPGGPAYVMRPDAVRRPSSRGDRPGAAPRHKVRTLALRLAPCHNTGARAPCPGGSAEAARSCVGNNPPGR